MKKKGTKVITLATALALAVTTVAWAAPHTQGTDPADSELLQNSDTTISIFTTAGKSAVISYTVPLYVTMAVASDSAEVIAPDNYGITNTSHELGNDAAGIPVGVTSISLQKISNAGFKTVKDVPAATAADDVMQLTIGGVLMPELSVAGTASKQPDGNVLWDGTKPAKLLSGEFKKLKIEGLVAKKDRSALASAATAQFRLKYTLSMIDSSGQSLGAIYAGDDHVEAGVKPDWDQSETQPQAQ